MVFKHHTNAESKAKITLQEGRHCVSDSALLPRVQRLTSVMGTVKRAVQYKDFCNFSGTCGWVLKGYIMYKYKEII